MQTPSSEMLCLRDSHLLLRNVDDHKAVRRKNWGFWNVVLSTYAENIMESPENQLWSASANGNFSRLAEKHQNPTAQVSGTCNTKAETWALSTDRQDWWEEIKRKTKKCLSAAVSGLAHWRSKNSKQQEGMERVFQSGNQCLEQTRYLKKKTPYPIHRYGGRPVLHRWWQGWPLPDW